MQIITDYLPVYDGNTSTANRVKDADGIPVDFGLLTEQDIVGNTPLTGHADIQRSGTISYQYDALGHLVRENDPFDSTAGLQGTTWVFSYDQGGNILSKAAYPFTEEETITGIAVHTDIYTYGNANWKDQLTAYNGVPITYDAIGNPLSDGTWTYTWQHGRQLAQMSKDGETVSFVYNEDGLRVQKTARAICKLYYNSTAYSSLNLGTKVSTVVKALKDGEKKPIQGKSDVSAGCMLISKSMEHMALSIGQYGYVEYSIIESAARFHGVHRTDDWEIGTGERQFYYYCPIKIVDYSTVPKYNPWEAEWIILK